MFLDVLLVWKQSKTSKSVSSQTKTVGFDTFSEAAMTVCTINRSAISGGLLCVDHLVVPDDLEAG